MNLLFHKGHWGQGTAPHAGHPVNAEFPVLCCLSVPYAEFSLKILQNDLTAPHVAGCAQTDLDRVLARRMKSELVVKVATIDFACCEVKVAATSGWPQGTGKRVFPGSAGEWE
jgi:hypothetical protein